MKNGNTMNGSGTMITTGITGAESIVISDKDTRPFCTENNTCFKTDFTSSAKGLLYAPPHAQPRPHPPDSTELVEVSGPKASLWEKGGKLFIS